MDWIAYQKLTQPKALGGLGFRDFKCFDEAFLAKSSWRLLHNPTGLLGRALMGKYCQDRDLLQCSPSSGASHGWRSVLVGRDLLKQNLGWVIGNGQSINMWDDPWLSLTDPERPMGPASEEHADLVVAELLDSSTGLWDPAKIQEILPPV